MWKRLRASYRRGRFDQDDGGERVEAQFDLTPERLIGDTAYGTAPMLAWMVEEKNIEPHVPVWDKTERKDDNLSSNDFHWNQEAN